MVILLLVLTIIAKHGLAEIYDFVPEDYLSSHRSNDVTENVDTEPKVDRIKYNELLSLLHNEYSNKALLAQISNPAKLNTTEKVSVERVTEQDNEFKDNTRLESEDWNRLKREDDITDKALLTKDIPMLGGNFNGLKGDFKGIVKGILKSDQDMNITEKITEQVAESTSIFSKVDTDKVTVEIDANNTRTKRHTALKLLRSLFHHNATAPTKKKSLVPLYLRQSPETKVNSTFTELIENLTESIKILNKRLSNLQLHVSENVGFVMIKVPLSEIEEKKYLKGIVKDDKNKMKSKNGNVRLKRELADYSTEVSNNRTLEYNTTQFNITNNDNSIIDAKEILEPTIISDSETINKLSELSKSKRDANITDADQKNGANDSKINTTEKSVDIPNFTLFDNNEGNFIKSKANESNTIKNESEPINNTTKLRDDTRKQFSKDNILFFIEKAYNDIKNLIIPINEIRDNYSSAILYKIGYIIAHLDTMKLSLNKLKPKVSNMQDSRRLQQVYKKLSMSKKLVANIMGYLNKYAGNQLMYNE